MCPATLMRLLDGLTRVQTNRSRAIKHPKSSEGFSVVEALVAIALLSAIALAGSQIIISLAKGQKAVSARAAHSDSATLVRLALAKPDVCKEAFKDASGTNVTIDPNVTEVDVKKVVFTSTGTSSVLVEEDVAGSLKLKLRKKHQFPPPSSKEYIYELELNLNISNALGPSIAKSTVPFYVKLGASNQIESCSPTENSNPPATTTCPAGQYMKGLNPDGSLICETFPTPAPSGATINTNRFMTVTSQGTQIKDLVYNAFHTEVYCPTGWKRMGCSGSRHPGLYDNCNEKDCGLVGIMPKDSPEGEGCEASTDPQNDNWAVVTAYCFNPNP